MTDITRDSTRDSEDLTQSEIKRVNDWIDKGILEHLPPALHNDGNDSVNYEALEELRNDVWVRLLPVIFLPDGSLNTKKAYGFGLSAGRDYNRALGKHYTPGRVGRADYPDQFAIERRDGTPLDDRFENTIIDDSDDHDVEAILSECEDDERDIALEMLGRERPDDYAFLKEVALRAYDRKGTTVQERSRLRDIRLWMAKRCPDGTFGKLKGSPRKKKVKTFTHEPLLLAGVSRRTL